jgi:opacity protein-like surface antigen
MKKVALMAVAFCAVVLVSASAFAGPLRAVGVEAGYVSPDTPEGAPDMNTWVAGVYLDFGLPATNFYVNPFVNYWNWSEGEGSAETSFHDWALGANVKWTIPTAGMISPFLAAGASAHMLNASAGSIDVSDTKFGFQLGGGASIGVSQRANIIGSGWYHMVEDVNQWSVRGGLEFRI